MSKAYVLLQTEIFYSLTTDRPEHVQFLCSAQWDNIHILGACALIYSYNLQYTVIIRNSTFVVK